MKFDNVVLSAKKHINGEEKSAGAFLRGVRIYIYPLLTEGAQLNKRRTLLAGLCSVPWTPSLLAAAPRPEGTSPASWQAKNYFPNFVVNTHDGRKLRFYDDLIKGRVVVINMMYANCTDTCPPSTANLLEVQRRLGDRVGKDVFMYSITVQPEFDNVFALRQYAEKYEIRPGWTFLTGKPDEIKVIRTRLGFFDPNPALDSNIQQHTGMIRIGNEKLQRWFMMPTLASSRQIAFSILNTV